MYPCMRTKTALMILIYIFCFYLQSYSMAWGYIYMMIGLAGRSRYACLLDHDLSVNVLNILCSGSPPLFPQQEHLLGRC